MRASGRTFATGALAAAKDHVNEIIPPVAPQRNRNESKLGPGNTLCCEADRSIGMGRRTLRLKPEGPNLCNALQPELRGEAV